MNLLDLPVELILTVLDWLTERQICLLGRTSKVCYNITLSDRVWKPRFMQRWSQTDLAKEALIAESEMGPNQNNEKIWRDQYKKGNELNRPFKKYFGLGAREFYAAVQEPANGTGFCWIAPEVPDNVPGLQIQKRVPFDAHERYSMRINKVIKHSFDELVPLILDPKRRSQWDEVLLTGNTMLKLDNDHDVVALLFQGALFILLRETNLVVQKGLRKFSIIEHSVPQSLLGAELSKSVVNLIAMFDEFDALNLDVIGGWEIEELDPHATKVTYVVRLLPMQEIAPDLLFDALCVQRANCLPAIEARIQQLAELAANDENNSDDVDKQNK